MSDDNRVKIEEQLRFFDENVEKVNLQDIFENLNFDAKKLARARLEKYYTKYGDANFHKTLEQLRIEQMEEIADAINYEIFKEFIKQELD